MNKEKKESGIAKLIELLNEYHHFNSDLIYYGWDKEYERVYFHSELPEEKKEELKNADALIDDGISEVRVEDERIISKKFGFIKWLVENDKIDLLQLDNRIALSKFNKVERVLMALSISSSPIEDLILYLK